MRRFLSPQRLSWMAVLGFAQVTAGSAMGDWFEAYETGNSVASTTSPTAQELEPSIVAALDKNLEEFQLAQPGSIADEAEARAAFPVVSTSFLESVTSRFQPASCDTVNCSAGGSRRGGLLPPWRPYLSGISGVDFATLDDDNAQSPAILNQSVFTIGGALGMAIDRPMGALRIEIEGRGRDQMTATDSDPVLGSLTTRATDIWSATVNVWRDYRPYESLGIYAGGGIGTGGYRSTLSGTGLVGEAYSGNDQVANFAWQAGGGVFYELTPRITFDVGYRFFAIDESTAVGYIFDQPFNYNERYSASELLLTVRVYEPFRRWR